MAKKTDLPKITGIAPLIGQLRRLITEARTQAVRSVDVIQVKTCWEVGRHIVEFEQGGHAHASYGKALLTRSAEQLTTEFGKGFDASNLRYMRLFYQAFQNCDALRHELSWTPPRICSLLRAANGQRFGHQTRNRTGTLPCSYFSSNYCS